MPSTTDRSIAGRYALQSPLGRGAMGTVWLADDSLLKRSVAVKEIDIAPGLDSEQRHDLEARLLREARAAARLSHPGVVSVYDVVEDGDRPWIVMEYVDAPTLEDRIKDEGPLTAQAAAAIGLDLLGVLEVAHAEGIVHRDVKPGNVMCPDDGQAKLADFGIASIQDDPKITQTGLVLGSPSFMAPEQASKGTSGPEGDLWSLGATLYHAVEGEPPFDRGAPLPTLTAVMGEDPRPMERAGALAPVIEGLLRKDPSARPTIAQVRDMLNTVMTSADHPDPDPVRVIDSDVEPHTTRTNRLPWLALVIGIAALIAVPLLLNDNHDQPPARHSGAGKNTAPSGGSAAAPADWTTYTDPDSGYTLSYPDTWGIRPGDPQVLDFTDPSNGTYLRVAWTSEPGDDVMTRLRDIADSFASQHSGYSELQMTETTYQGNPAGLWEYTYEEDGASLHAYNLQFLVGDKYGFALNFQTHEEDWASSQDVWDELQATFRPPS